MRFPGRNGVRVVVRKQAQEAVVAGRGSGALEAEPGQHVSPRIQVDQAGALAVKEQ